MALAELFLFTSTTKTTTIGLGSIFIPQSYYNYVVVLGFVYVCEGRGKVAALRKDRSSPDICMHFGKKKRPASLITLHPITSSSRSPPHRQPQAPSLSAILSSWGPLRSASEGCRRTIPWRRRPLCPRACPPQPRPHRRR